MVLLVEKLTANIKSETTEMVSKLKDKVSADLYEQNAKLFKISDELKTEVGFQIDDVNSFRSDGLIAL